MKSAGKLVVIAGLLGGSAYAGVVTLATSPGALGANDTVAWGQLGTDSTPIPNTFSTTSAGSLTVGGSFSASSTGDLVDAGTSWTPVVGAFSNGDALIWAFDGTNGSGPLTFTFPTGFGAGAAIQSDVVGQFTAKLELFNGAFSVGSVTETSNVAGDAIFIGALDDTAEVTKAVFSLTAAPAGNQSGDFAIDTLNLQDVSNTPEPGSVFMLAGGLAGLLKLRRRFSRA